MNHLKLIFGCGGKECPSSNCIVNRLNRSLSTPSERLRWWNELQEKDKGHVQKETFDCDRNNN